MERGKDIYALGGKYNNTSINALGVATAADSLAAIKKLVFDDGKLTLPELVDILKSNWEGNELLRQRVKKTFPKYGMGDDEVDSYARISLERLADRINGRPNAKGGVYRLGAFTVDWRFHLARRLRRAPTEGLRGRPCPRISARPWGATARELRLISPWRRGDTFGGRMPLAGRICA